MLRIAVARIAAAPADSGHAGPAWLGDSERRRWMALRSAARREFAASRVLVRQLLQEASGIAADLWHLTADADSAPVATAPGLRTATIHASLSHRLGWVAAAVSDAAVGVDIECERPARSDAHERAALMLSPAELAQWQALPADELDAALLTAWTVKEAWFKASPPEAVPWDFSRVVARACLPGQANARTWAASPLHVALCCDRPQELAAAACTGLDDAAARTSFWRVGPVASMI